MTLVDSLTRGDCIEREAINPARAKVIKEKRRGVFYTEGLITRHLVYYLIMSYNNPTRQKSDFILKVNSFEMIFQLEHQITYRYRSDSSKVSCRAISIGCKVSRSKVSMCPGLLICHSTVGGEL